MDNAMSSADKPRNNSVKGAVRDRRERVGAWQEQAEMHTIDNSHRAWQIDS